MGRFWWWDTSYFRFIIILSDLHIRTGMYTHIYKRTGVELSSSSEPDYTPRSWCGAFVMGSKSESARVRGWSGLRWWLMGAQDAICNWAMREPRVAYVLLFFALSILRSLAALHCGLINQSELLYSSQMVQTHINLQPKCICTEHQRW